MTMTRETEQRALLKEVLPYLEHFTDWSLDKEAAHKLHRKVLALLTRYDQEDLAVATED